MYNTGQDIFNISRSNKTKNYHTKPVTKRQSIEHQRVPSIDNQSDIMLGQLGKQGVIVGKGVNLTRGVQQQHLLQSESHSMLAGNLSAERLEM